MRTPLCNHDLFDPRPTPGAGLTLSTVHPEPVLMVPATVDPIDAGPIVAEAFLEGGPDPLP